MSDKRYLMCCIEIRGDNDEDMAARATVFGDIAKLLDVVVNTYANALDAVGPKHGGAFIEPVEVDEVDYNLLMAMFNARNPSFALAASDVAYGAARALAQQEEVEALVEGIRESGRAEHRPVRKAVAS